MMSLSCNSIFGTSSLTLRLGRLSTLTWLICCIQNLNNDLLKNNTNLGILRKFNSVQVS